MHRLSFSILGGFILIYLESLFVMKVHGYSSIHFPDLSKIFMVWILNFFVLYSLVFFLPRHLSRVDDETTS